MKVRVRIEKAGGQRIAKLDGRISKADARVIEQGTPMYSLLVNVRDYGRKPENGGNGKGFQENLSYTLDTVGVHGVCIRSFARKLTPLECERLMGFPDNWTRISWRGKPPEECPDNHRYRACGNSMCVNVMRWIGNRIDMVDKGIDPNKN